MKIYSAIKSAAIPITILLCILLSENFTSNVLKNQGLDFWMSATVFESLGKGDAQTYVHNGQFFAGLVDPDHEYWREINVPPGLPLVIAAILLTSGPENYFVKMLAISAVCWTLLWTLVFYWIPFISSPAVRLLAILSLAITPALRDAAVGNGYFHSEGIGLAVFGIAILFFFRGVWLRNFKFIFTSVIFFAAAAHFRGLFDAICFGTILMVAGLLFVSVFCRALIILINENRHFFSYRHWKSALNAPSIQTTFRSLKIAIACVFIYTAAVYPWKSYVREKAGVFKMAGHASEEYVLHWRKADQGGGFEHAMNPACETDPKLCKIIHENYESMRPYFGKLSLMTMLSHPGAWLAFKLKDISWFWMGFDWKDFHGGLLYYWLQSIGFLIAAFYCYIAPWVGKMGILKAPALGRRRLSEVYLFILGMTATHLLLILIIHYEARYSLALRQMFLMTALYIYFLKKDGAKSPENSRINDAMFNL